MVKFPSGQGCVSILLFSVVFLPSVELTVYEGYLIHRIPTLRQHLPYCAKDKELVDINVSGAVWVTVIFGSYLRLRVLVVN